MSPALTRGRAGQGPGLTSVVSADHRSGLWGFSHAALASGHLLVVGCATAPSQTIASYTYWELMGDVWLLKI